MDTLHIARLIDWLMYLTEVLDWLIDWLIEMLWWFNDWLIDVLDWFFDWLIDWLIIWLIDVLDWLFDWSISETCSTDHKIILSQSGIRRGSGKRDFSTSVQWYAPVILQGWTVATRASIVSRGVTVGRHIRWRWMLLLLLLLSSGDRNGSQAIPVAGGWRRDKVAVGRSSSRSFRSPYGAFDRFNVNFMAGQSGLLKIGLRSGDVDPAVGKPISLNHCRRIIAKSTAGHHLHAGELFENLKWKKCNSQSINQSTIQMTNRSIDQSIINQSINQSTNREVKVDCHRMHFEMAVTSSCFAPILSELTPKM